MNLKQLLRVIHQYDAELMKRELAAQRHQGTNSPFADAYGQLQHARWMCQEITRFLPKHKGPASPSPDPMAKEKAMRWLGFIQGVLWSTGTRSIDEMRKDNTSAPDADTPSV